jgi:hemerythrin-like metal-binding protein
MNLMTWSDHFVTGIGPVDAQHRALVDMINTAAPHLASGTEAAQAAAGPLLDKLVSYAASHFQYEEDLMREARLVPDYFAQHQHTHQTFVEEVLQMRAQYDKGESLGGNDLLHFLTSWLTFHILSEDQHMARQVLAVRSGQSAAQAFAALDTSQGAPQAVYNAALVDLFSLLTTRNRNLSAANAEVLEAKRALEGVNSALEQRVQERTHALAEANGTLQAERETLVQTIARLKETQEQLLQSEKMAAVGQLAAGVAHEINNPIGFVSSNLGTLTTYVAQMLELLGTYEKARVGLPPALRSAIEALPAHTELAYIREDVPELLKDCKEGLVRVKRIVSGLRDFSHRDAGNWAPADINAALESALLVAGNELKYKADVVKEFAPLPPVLCLSAQLGQVFVNLLVNAAQAITQHGTITVRTGVTGEQVWIEIADTGVGMSAQTQKRIFEPFYTTKAVGQGTGLGLSISWEIVKRHQGQIEVRSEPGQGTCFRITLPCSPPAATEQA